MIDQIGKSLSEHQIPYGCTHFQTLLAILIPMVIVLDCLEYIIRFSNSPPPNKEQKLTMVASCTS